MFCRDNRLTQKPFAISGVLLGSLLCLGLLSCNGATDLLPIGNTVTVSMTPADRFSPDEISVQAGDTVKFVNTDSDPHAPITDPLNDAAGGPNSDSVYPSGVPAGGSYSWHVPSGATVGTEWYFHCRFHGTAGDGNSVGTGMVGEIVVE